MTLASRVLLFVAALAVTPIALFVFHPDDPKPPVPRALTSVDQALKAAKVLEPNEGSASCLPIGEYFGYIACLTAKHVIDAEPHTVLFRNGDRLPVLFTAVHPTCDAGIIWVRANPHAPIASIPIADKSPPAGTQVVFAGYPLGVGVWVSQGILGDTDSDGDTCASAPIYFGGSGGPVLSGGRVVGIGTGVYSDPYRPGPAVSTMSAITLVGSFRDWLRENLARDPSVK